MTFLSKQTKLTFFLYYFSKSPSPSFILLKNKRLNKQNYITKSPNEKVSKNEITKSVMQTVKKKKHKSLYSVLAE